MTIASAATRGLVKSQLPPRNVASTPKLTESVALGGMTTAEVLLRGMRVGEVSVLPVGSFPLHLLIV